MNLPSDKRAKLVFSVRMFSEITIKSTPVRKRLTKFLARNIRVLGRQIHTRTSVVQDWDRIEVRVPCNGENTRAAFIDLLSCTPGIANFAEVNAYPLESFNGIAEKTLRIWRQELVGKTFCVRVKRTGQHNFTSVEVERYVGGVLNTSVASAGVKLKGPDVVVHLEIKDDMFLVASGKYPGIGGFPMGSLEPVLSLVSGGFDSSVASYQMIQRGVRTHFCFFSLGGWTHELGVKKAVHYLWEKYASSHRVRFITVPFEDVAKEIAEKISPAVMGVVLKRMMLRAATTVAERSGVEALVTGEAISQVSSQTLPNLSIIDKVTDTLVLRPLIAMAKPDIIATAREIGVETFAASMEEYCGMVSIKPSAKVKLEQVLEEENRFNFALLDSAVRNCQLQYIDQVMDDCREQSEVDTVVNVPDRAVVIDIRHPDEREIRPFTLAENDILTIPFYKLNKAFEALDQDKAFYLYCEKGVMSELHAAHLKGAGYANVGVYRPDRAGSCQVDSVE